MHFMVQLDNCRAVFVGSEHATTAEQALEWARQELQQPDAKHIHTLVYKGQTLSEVIRG